MCTPYPEFVLTGVICIEKALKGTEIVYVFTIAMEFNEIQLRSKQINKRWFEINSRSI